METTQVKRIIEALLFITDTPVSTETIISVLGEAADGQDVDGLIKEIEEDYNNRNSSIELRYVAGGWQMSTRKEMSAWIRRLYKDKTTLRLSTSALETLSIVAYKQPITRAEIEDIRGVEVTAVLETLLERKLIRIAGRKETVGRPLLYGTTIDFLKHFGLTHLSELPSLEELSPPEEPVTESADSESGEYKSEEGTAVQKEPGAESGTGQENA